MFLGAAAIGWIVCLYGVFASWPAVTEALVGFGALMLVEGVILLVYGIKLSLPPFPFYGDTLACFVVGRHSVRAAAGKALGLLIFSTIFRRAERRAPTCRLAGCRSKIFDSL